MRINLSFLFLIFIFFLKSDELSAQNNYIDSIYKKIQKLPDSKAKVDSLLQLQLKTIIFSRPEFLEEALEIAKKIYYIDGIGIAYDRKGYVERKKNNFVKSIEYHKRALGFLENSKDTLARMRCLNNMAVSFRKINFEQEAYKYYLLELDLATKSHNEIQIARTYNGIGNVFVNTEEYDKAMYYFAKSLEIQKKYGISRGLEYNMANIGELYVFKKQFDSAEVYLNKSLELAKQLYQQNKLGVEYNLLGLLHKNKGECTRAIDDYKRALPMLKRQNIQRYISNTHINLGLCQLKKGLKDDALQHIQEGIKIAKKIASKENISLGYDALVTYYKQINDYKNALNAHIMSTQYHDSIVNVTSKNSIITAQIIYETKEKDEKIKRLALEKEREKKISKRNFFTMIATIFISLVVLVFLYVLFILYRKNTDLELAQKNSEIQNYIMRINEMKKSKSFELNQENKIFLQKINNLNLTKREQKVLELIAKGSSNDEIAETMHISKNTVKSHIKNIYQKLDVKNRIQVIQKIRNS